MEKKPPARATRFDYTTQNSNTEVDRMTRLQFGEASKARKRGDIIIDSVDHSERKQSFSTTMSMNMYSTAQQWSQVEVHLFASRPASAFGPSKPRNRPILGAAIFRRTDGRG
jgi:hypothetical protein